MSNEAQRQSRGGSERVSIEEMQKQINLYLQSQGNINQAETLQDTLDILFQAKKETSKLQQKLKQSFDEISTLQKIIYEDVENIKAQIELNINDLQELGDKKVTQNFARVLKLKCLIQQSSQKNNQMQLAIQKLQDPDFPLTKPIQNQLELIVSDLKVIKQAFQKMNFDSVGLSQKLFSVKDTSFCYQFEVSQSIIKKVIIELQNTEKFDQHHRAIQLTENILLVSGGQKQEGRLTLINENQVHKFSQLKGRYSHGVAFDNGENVFLIAGTKSERTCEIFKYKSNQHEFISNYPFYAFSHSCAMLYDFVFGFGGKDKDSDVFSNGIFYYDKIANKWSRHQSDLPNGYKTLSVFLPQKDSIFIFNNGNPQNQIQQFDGVQINQICEDQNKGFCYNVPQFYGDSIFFYNENLKLWEYNAENLKFRKLN